MVIVAASEQPKKAVDIATLDEVELRALVPTLLEQIALLTQKRKAPSVLGVLQVLDEATENLP